MVISAQAEGFRHTLATLVPALMLAVMVGTAWGREPTDAPSSLGSDGTTVRELKACSNELPLGSPSRLERATHDGRGLVVLALANANCGEVQPVEPRATIDRNHVQLSWFWYMPPGRPVLRCLCTRRLEFVVPHGKDLKQPQIDLSGLDWSRRQPSE